MHCSRFLQGFSIALSTNRTLATALTHHIGSVMLRKLIEKWRRLMLPTRASTTQSDPIPPGQTEGLIDSANKAATPANDAAYSLQELDFDSLYPELKRIARLRMRSERADHTLQPTALINELYLQLLRRPDFKWTDRNHFLLYAARAMRNLLVDYAKKHHAAKRWPGGVQIDLGNVVDSLGLSNINNMLDIDEALTELAAAQPRLAKVVELRFFAGLGFVEIGAILGVTDRTAKRDWALAEEWLQNRLSGGHRGRGRMGGA